MFFGIYRINKIFVFTLVTAVFLLIAALIVTSILNNNDTIFKGVYIDGYDVSGMTEDEAYEEIRKALDLKFSNVIINLKYDDYIYKLPLKESGCVFLINEAVRKAFLTGREGNILKRFKDVSISILSGTNISPGVMCNREIIGERLLKIKEQIDRPCKNAGVTVKNNNVIFIEEEKGYNLDIEKNIDMITQNLLQKNFDTIIMLIDEKLPDIKYNDICEIKDILSSFRTHFNKSYYNRANNIKLACNKLNNSIILPGSIFSVDSTLGPRTKEAGYLDAPIIFNGELIQGAGGGICQVTSTLYGAVLRAGLEIVERTPHSMTLSYVEPGQDATIVENAIDFKFRNNLDYALCIITEVMEGDMTISVLGRKKDFSNIIIRSEVLEVYYPEEEELIIDETVKEGDRIIVQQPKYGYKTAVWRDYYDENGKVLRSEKISEDIYKSVRGRTKVSSDYVNYQY